MGVALIGPDYAAERLWGWAPTDDQLPKLRNLSDLYWLYWRSLNNAAGTRIDNLKTYVVYSIHNEATVQIIARALRSRGKEAYEPWPGQYFASESAQGLALLGRSRHQDETATWTKMLTLPRVTHRCDDGLFPDPA